MWGSNSTMNNLPHVREYDHALKILNTTKPISGSGHNAGRVPLGARKDVSKYWARSGSVDATDVEFILYQTPIITYKADGRIIVSMGSWNSITTREFINTILRVSCYAKSGKPVIELHGPRNEDGTGNPKSIIPHAGILLRCNKTPDSNSQPVLTFDTEAKPVIMGYSINRAKANNVRKRYSEFRKYLKTTISLRKTQVEITHTWYHGMRQAETEPTFYDAIEYTIGEVADGLGIVKATSENGLNRSRVNQAEWNQLHRKPVGHIRPQGFNTYEQWIAQYTAKCEEFFGLVKNNQPEETKHANFYKAFLVLLCMHAPNSRQAHSIEDPSKVVSTTPRDIETNFEGAFRRYYAADILEEVAMKGGVPPNKTYIEWMWMHNRETVSQAEQREVEDKKTSIRL
jgi:hypothetical protein